jgi:hypothetical protein
MSSTTILFVLNKILGQVNEENKGCRILSCAFGGIDSRVFNSKNGRLDMFFIDYKTFIS